MSDHSATDDKPVFNLSASAPEATATAPTVDLSARVEEALTSVATAMRNGTFYGLQHSVALAGLQEATDRLNALTADRAELQINVQTDQFIFDNLPLPDYVGTLVPLAEELTARDVGRITWLPDIERHEIAALAEVLITDPKALELQGGAKGALEANNVTHILLEPRRSDQRDEEQREALQIYQDAVNTVHRAMNAVERGQAIDAMAVRTVVEEMLGSLLYDSSGLVSLAAIKSYDEYLYEHSVNVCIVSMVFGCTLGLNEKQMMDLGMAGILHDIGKVFIPLDIVRKPGPLTEEEWMVMHTHPLVGAKVLATTPGVPDLAAVVAFEHHIKYDRSGYPKAARPRSLNFYSHICTIVDCYDSLTTVRPYRAPVRPEHAAGYMLYSSQGQFEPRLLRRFASLLRLYPVGAIVKLNTGEWAAVSNGSERDPARPVVRMLVDASGALVRGFKRADLSERDTHGGYSRSIVDCLQPVSRIADMASVLIR
jgi:HD-GYP domain-containing protein (c-di-GMP phosphodiesterase class II)